MIVCTYENRLADLTGGKLLTLSLAEHCPDLPVDFSSTKGVGDFFEWLSRFPQVRARELSELDGRGWNVKPAILLGLLDEGQSEVVWLDSDVIATADFRPLLCGIPAETLVATEEPAWGAVEGSATRTLGWGLQQGRMLARTANTCLLRVTRHHRPLLEAWQRLLDAPEYVAAQARPWNERPVHMLSDQDALTALLGSREFAGLQVRLLRRGRDVLQGFDPSTYTVADRLRNGAAGLPPLVHAQRDKPWQLAQVPPAVREPRRYFARAYMELSPYTHVARRYQDQLGEPADWATVSTGLAKTLRFLAAGSVNRQGIPHALAARAMRPFRRVLVR